MLAKTERRLGKLVERAHRPGRARVGYVAGVMVLVPCLLLMGVAPAHAFVAGGVFALLLFLWCLVCPNHAVVLCAHERGFTLQQGRERQVGPYDQVLTVVALRHAAGRGAHAAPRYVVAQAHDGDASLAGAGFPRLVEKIVERARRMALNAAVRGLQQSGVYQSPLGPRLTRKAIIVGARVIPLCHVLEASERHLEAVGPRGPRRLRLYARPGMDLVFAALLEKLRASPTNTKTRPRAAV